MQVCGHQLSTSVRHSSISIKSHMQQEVPSCERQPQNVGAYAFREVSTPEWIKVMSSEVFSPLIVCVHLPAWFAQRRLSVASTIWQIWHGKYVLQHGNVESFASHTSGVVSRLLSCSFGSNHRMKCCIRATCGINCTHSVPMIKTALVLNATSCVLIYNNGKWLIFL